MAGFPPAYQHESNDIWLDESANDDINSAPVRHASSRRRTRSKRHREDEDGEKPRLARSNSVPGRRPAHIRMGTISNVPSTSGSTSVSDGRTSPESHISQPPPAYSQQYHSLGSSLSLMRPESAESSKFSTMSSAQRANFRKTWHVPSRQDTKMLENAISETKQVLFDKQAIQTSPAAERRLSTASGFSGFESHPAVRPLVTPKVRGGAADDAAEYPGPLALTLIVLGICLSVFTISLDRNIITTAIPDITARFHSYDDIGWYGSAYLLTASAFQPVYGRIYMSFATKSSFLTALVIFEIGSLLAAICSSSSLLIVGRAIQGLGSAGLLTGAFVVGTHSVRLQHRPVLFAAVGILYGVGALCGPLLGGTFTDTIGWRWCFWINLPIGMVTFVTVCLCFKGKSPSSTMSGTPFTHRVIQLDIIGNIILLGAMTMLFLALQFSEQQYSWSSARCIGLLCGFGVTTLIFVAWMLYRGDAALIPPRIIRQRTVAASCGAAVMIYGALLVHSYYLPIWFQAIKGTSAIHSGVNMIPYMVANALFSLLAGVFVSKNGLFAPPAILGCAIGTVGSGLLATLTESSPSSHWIGFEILVSAGLGMAIQQGFSAVQAMLPLDEVPIGTAAVVASQSLGGAVFVSVGNTLLQSHLLNKNNEQIIPGVNIRAVIELGATQFRRVVPAQDLPTLIHLYNESLQAVFIAAVPLCGVAFLCSLCMEWKSLNNRGENTREAEQTSGTEKV
ncbi:uncharacterized protein Z518_00093 [Rhinocladiella mackenziei CBS 650.93]|uniref:Major facilitator superfamily (MFS) profile domain-containing protein n=1 Tax=Rhinocladiella mackenziei CBS 650.93 TaxID=1442369 RepID=A0A0D2JI50_9EURO|nr:uncharacterized protein Z518_00093 [Rhinocladiella mackenziei CBS 650.93]KIX09015.1 hypothetical protein Z518_00093 [Rhinocladiella mackenziei CBS 650.93]